MDGDLREKAPAEEFIHIFVNKPDHLLEFLEFIVDEGEATAMVFNTLLELYLSRSATASSKEEKQQNLSKALAVLKNPAADYNESHALVLVKMHNFSDGVLFLYERLKLYHEIVQFQMDNALYDDIIRSCHRYGLKDANLWIEVLSYFAGR